MVDASNDLLKFGEEPEITGKMFEGEEIVFSCHVYKKNHFGFKQKRNMLLTNIRLHNLEEHKIKRSMEISKLKALTKNIKDNN